MLAVAWCSACVSLLPTPGSAYNEASRGAPLPTSPHLPLNSVHHSLASEKQNVWYAAASTQAVLVHRAQTIVPSHEPIRRVSPLSGCHFGLVIVKTANEGTCTKLSKSEWLKEQLNE